MCLKHLLFKVKNSIFSILPSRRFCIISLFILGILLIIAILPRLGTWFIVEEELQPADAMVILMGSTADRALAAHDVYSDSLTSNIIIVESIQREAVHIKPYKIHVPNVTAG